MTKKEKALETFGNNFNCSQAVLSVFAEELGIEKEIYLKISTSFGGGMRKGEACGAVTGALMELGLNHGHFESDDSVSKDKSYELTKEFIRRFEDSNKSIVCKKLLGYNPSIPEEAKIIKEKGLSKTICSKLIVDAIGILEDILAKNK